MPILTKADTEFSIFIRRRDADEYGFIRCITCGKRVHWKQADNGHYQKRGKMSVRFDEINCNAQCRECNGKDNDKLYRSKLIEKVGIKEVEALEKRANIQRKYFQWEIDEIEQEYKQRNLVCF